MLFFNVQFLFRHRIFCDQYSNRFGIDLCVSFNVLMIVVYLVKIIFFPHDFKLNFANCSIP